MVSSIMSVVISLPSKMPKSIVKTAVTETGSVSIPVAIQIIMTVSGIESWEGHYELVKLNLDNQEVQDYIKDSIRYWIEYFDIDGIRLDVAYLLPRWFMAMISDYARSLKPDFFMLGEVIGDNADYMYSEGHLEDINTDYPCYKSIWFLSIA